MTFAPRFSSEGNEVIMSMAKDGNTEIYTVDLRTRRQTRLTNHPAIDTSPSFSPDSRQITFTSDRGGSLQSYVMNRDGRKHRWIRRRHGERKSHRLNSRQQCSTTMTSSADKKN